MEQRNLPPASVIRAIWLGEGIRPFRVGESLHRYRTDVNEAEKGEMIW
jgi:hypothetical protein